MTWPTTRQRQRHLDNIDRNSDPRDSWEIFFNEYFSVFLQRIYQDFVFNWHWMPGRLWSVSDWRQILEWRHTYRDHALQCNQPTGIFNQNCFTKIYSTKTLHRHTYRYIGSCTVVLRYIQAADTCSEFKQQCLLGPIHIILVKRITQDQLHSVIQF